MGCTPFDEWFEEIRGKLAAEMGECLADMGVTRLEVVFVKENEMKTRRNGFAICGTLIGILVVAGILAIFRSQG